MSSELQNAWWDEEETLSCNHKVYHTCHGKEEKERQGVRRQNEQ